jgi:hypothetical protein
LINETLGEMQPLCVRDRKWRCTQVFCEQTPQVATGHTESIGKLLDITIV